VATIHVVTDLKGAGRVVGAFSDEERAHRVQAVDPNYFRLITLDIDTINPSAVEWLPSAEKREALSSM
jgi:hypothetical protein